MPLHSWWISKWSEFSSVFRNHIVPRIKPSFRSLCLINAERASNCPLHGGLHPQSSYAYHIAQPTRSSLSRQTSALPLPWPDLGPSEETVFLPSYLLLSPFLLFLLWSLPRFSLSLLVLSFLLYLSLLLTLLSDLSYKLKTFLLLVKQKNMPLLVSVTTRQEITE